MIEKPYRSIVKTLSWRFVATLSTMVISFMITGELAVAVSIGVFEFFAKIILYYLHERIWNKITFGKVIPRDDYKI